MALADYRLCDKCQKKTFYDANLNYGEWNSDTKQMNLDHLGDWAVICKECTEKWECIIVERERKLTAD